MIFLSFVSYMELSRESVSLAQRYKRQLQELIKEHKISVEY